MDVIAAGELAAHLGAVPDAIGKAVAGFSPGRLSAGAGIRPRGYRSGPLNMF